jgi:hypothetical protein
MSETIEYALPENPDGILVSLDPDLTLHMTINVQYVKDSMRSDGGLRLLYPMVPAKAFNLAAVLIGRTGQIGGVSSIPGAEQKLLEAYRVIREVEKQLAAQPNSSMN